MISRKNKQLVNYGKINSFVQQISRQKQQFLTINKTKVANL